MVEFTRTWALLKECFSGTTLHGWAYLSKDEPRRCQKFLNLFWSLVIIASICLSGWFVYTRFDEFLNSDVIISTDTRTASLADVYFPSIVICNVNQLRKSFIYDVVKDNPDLDNDSLSEMWDALLRMFIDGYPKDKPGPNPNFPKDSELIGKFLGAKKFDELLEKFFNEEIINKTFEKEMFQLTYRSKLFRFKDDLKELLFSNETKYRLFRHLSRQWKDEMIINLNWKGGSNVILKQGFGSDQGICEWITPHNSPETFHLSKVKPGCETGFVNGIELLLNAEVYDYGTRTEESGFIITVLHNMDVPLLGQSGMKIGPGTDVDIAVTPKIITYNDDIMVFDPKDRNCYREREFHFQYLDDDGTNYKIANCLFEAAVQQVIQNCSQNNYLNPFALGTLTYNLSVPGCYGNCITCSERIMTNLGKYRNVTVGNDTFKCLGACKTQTYTPMVSSNAYPNEVSFKYTKTFCIVVRQLVESTCLTRSKSLKGKICELVKQLNETKNFIEYCPEDHWQKHEAFDAESDQDEFEQEVVKYTRENIAKVNVFIREPFAERIIISRKISLMSLVSDIGGLMGLCMGFSFVSIIEILFHAFKITTSILQWGNDKVKVTSKE